MRSCSDGSSNEKPLTVCFIAGDRKTSHCGVKDYAHRLTEELCGNQVHAQVQVPSGWSLRSFLHFHRQIRHIGTDITHIQYPAIGYRYSLFPQLLGWLRIGGKICVTFHEYSSLPLIQRLSMHLFRWTAQTIVFTTDKERDGFRSILGTLGAPHLVIPIASNVPTCPTIGCREPVVLYFGQIRPDKGIEAFLELARISTQQNAPFRFQIIGSCLSRNVSYLDDLKHRDVAQIEWILDEPLELVAERMSHALAAYLPFPDGATYRRGSLLAAFANSLPVVTVITEATPFELSQVVLSATDGNEALQQIRSLYESPEFAAEKQYSSKREGERYSWPVIVKQHKLLYNRVIQRSTPS